MTANQYLVPRDARVINAPAYGPSIQLGGAMRMAAISFGGVSLIRNWLKRSRMSSGRRGEAQNAPSKNALYARAEEIVSKRLTSFYRSGPSRAWLKIKNPKAPAATRAIDGTF